MMETLPTTANKIPHTVENVPRPLTTKELIREILIPSISVILASSVLVVNKYILTSLGFQFPTLFLGWQTLAHILILKLDSVVLDSSNTNLGKKWKKILIFSPVILLHFISLYLGSKALSRLRLHIYLPLQNLSLVIREVLTILPFFLQTLCCCLRRNSNSGTSGKSPLPDARTYLLLLLISVAAYLVSLEDLRYSAIAYRWLAYHIVASAAAHVYANHALVASRADLTAYEALLVKNVGSFFLLFLTGLSTGETFLAREFPHWRLYRFYLACFASGCLGGAFNLFTFRIEKIMRMDGCEGSNESKDWKTTVAELNVISKFSISATSFIYFATLNSNNESSLTSLLMILLSFSAEFIFHRVNSNIPSITWHLLLSYRDSIIANEKTALIEA